MGTPKGTVPHNAGKGNGWISRGGYRVKSVTKNGKRQHVREHRLIMETHLGRNLEPWEVVHHKDGNTLNNAISNLAVMTFGEHTIEHHAGSRQAYESKRSMEAFANLREDFKRERALKSELLAALEAVLPILERLSPTAQAFILERKQARVAIAKAKGEA